jgi:hypothetical protein
VWPLAAGLVTIIGAAFLGSDGMSARAAGQARRIANFGVDIRADGSATPLPFYDGQPARGGDDGRVLNAGQPQIDVSIATPNLAGAMIHGFELFIDAEDVQGGDAVSLELLRASPAGYVRIITLGYPGKQAEVPVSSGPLGRHAATPYKQDRAPNTFLLTSPPGPASAPVVLPLAQYADNIVKGYFRLRLRLAAPAKSKTDSRIDGVNLQVELTPAAGGI